MLATAVRRDLIVPGVWGARLRSHTRPIRYSSDLRS
jgi:hypothetical protein